MKLSELNEATAADHIRTEPDDPMLTVYLDAAKNYVLGYTGLDAAQADEFPELAVAALITAADMYDHRMATVDSQNVNRTLASLLAMHRRNLV